MIKINTKVEVNHPDIKFTGKVVKAGKLTNGDWIYSVENDEDGLVYGNVEDNVIRALANES